MEGLSDRGSGQWIVGEVNKSDGFIHDGIKSMCRDGSRRRELQ